MRRGPDACIAPRGGVDVGAPTTDELLGPGGDGPSHITDGEADDDKPEQHEPYEHDQGDSLTEGVLERACDEGPEIAPARGKRFRLEHADRGKPGVGRVERQNGLDRQTKIKATPPRMRAGT